MNLFDIEELEKKLKSLEEETLQENFWQNVQKSNKVLAEIKKIKNKVIEYRKIEKESENLIELSELLNIEPDEELAKEVIWNTRKVENEFNKLEISTLFSGKYDSNNAIVTIHPGAGGTESQDWAEMLYRMYLRYCERKGYKVTLYNYQAGEEAGIKSVSFKVDGSYAYGYLKEEKGVHRLVRLSPFDSSNRRHTSFASVDVTPEIDKNIDINIEEKDIRIDVYRSTGAGGQGVNTTDSAVRVTHLPTGIVVTCQNERSQIQNKETALQVLKSKLYVLEQQKKEQELAKEKGEQMNIEFGSQIRSYVMHPYSMVKDHRTSYETSNVTKVLDGDLTPFMEAYLKGAKNES